MSELDLCKKLLETNYNLILTGAPGVGKTFLAKKIAESFGATVENGRCKIVQFHPSLDYTDFVEGLRPTRSSNESVVSFEYKKGVFKEFCTDALNNLIDSSKSINQIASERNIEERYALLLEEIESGKVGEIPLRSGGTMKTTISSLGNIQLKASDGQITYTVSLRRIKELAEVYKNADDLDNITNITQGVYSVIRGCNASAYWAVLKYLYTHYNDLITNNIEPIQKQNYVFIIDEINRGEISKIFGELFFSIDPGYRGVKGKVITQYQNLIDKGDDFDTGFFVPENVYIIGTMNDIDRSVDCMDFAMRRRFAWKEISVESQMGILDDENAWNNNEKPDLDVLNDLKARMYNLNKAIIDEYHPEDEDDSALVGLTKAYQIGPAYFLKYGIYKNFDDLWNFHLKGLLFEYLRGTVNTDMKMDLLFRAYNDNYRNEND